jgi:Ca2+-binding EF-hand superfamily protein
MYRGGVKLTPLLLVAWVAIAAAQTTPTAAPESNLLAEHFRQADHDGDGVLSAAEAQQAAWFVKPEQFNTLDRDHSGTVTLLEIATAISQQVQEWLATDSDGDGRITASEARRQPTLADVWRRADIDADGVITRVELEEFSQRYYYGHSELPSVAPNIIEKRF